MVPVLSRSREFSLFLDGTGTGKNWSRKKVPVPVPEKFGPGKKYRSRYRKKIWVPSHSGVRGCVPLLCATHQVNYVFEPFHRTLNRVIKDCLT